jgi:hypothetical protein
VSDDSGWAPHDRLEDRVAGAPLRRQPTSFTGDVTLSSDRYVRDFGTVSEEIISHLVGTGTDLTICVGSEATRVDGFDAAVHNLTETAERCGSPSMESADWPGAQ